MDCMLSSLGWESYYTLLAIAVGAVVRVTKRWLPADAVPAVAFAVGYAADLAVRVSGCGVSLADTLAPALAGGLAGLGAGGGAEALTRSARALDAILPPQLRLAERAALWVVGRAKAAAPPPPRAPLPADPGAP